MFCDWENINTAIVANNKKLTLNTLIFLNIETHAPLKFLTVTENETFDDYIALMSDQRGLSFTIQIVTIDSHSTNNYQNKIDSAENKNDNSVQALINASNS